MHVYVHVAVKPYHVRMWLNRTNQPINLWNNKTRLFPPDLGWGFNRVTNSDPWDGRNTPPPRRSQAVFHHDHHVKPVYEKYSTENGVVKLVPNS